MNGFLEKIYALFAGLDRVMNNDRIEIIKYLLSNKNLLLPPLSSEWIKDKNIK